MSDLTAFLNPAYSEKRIAFTIGDRFLDENGEPIKIIMRSISQEELDAIGKRSTRTIDVGGSKVEKLDEDEYVSRCIVASMVFPDLTNREICLKCKTEDPVYVPRRLFLPPEYKKISAVFGALHGVEPDEKLSSLGEVTKN